MKHCKYVVVLLTMLHMHQANALNRINAPLDTAMITIKNNQAIKQDSLIIEIYDRNYLGINTFTPPVTVITKNVAGNFQFRIPMEDSLAYFSLKSGADKKRLLEFYLLEPDDDVVINMDDKGIEFSGTNAAKYQCRFELDTAFDRLNYSLAYSTDNPEGISDAMKNKDYKGMLNDSYEVGKLLRDSQIVILKKHEKLVRPLVYAVLYADVIGKSHYQAINANSFFLVNGNISARDPGIKDMINHHLEDYWYIPDRLPVQALAFSRNYVEYIFKRIAVEAAINPEYGKAGKRFKTDFSADLRDKLLTVNLIRRLKYTKSHELDSLFSDAMAVVENSRYLNILNTLKNETQIGKEAVDFALPDNKGNIIRLSDFRGKLVFLDFWYTGCGPCKIYYSNCLAQVKKKYRDNPNIVFITISIDKDRQKWLTSIENEDYTSKDAINLYTEGLGNNHEVVKQYNVIGFPTPKLINQNGEIQVHSVFELGGGSVSRPEQLVNTIEKFIASKQ